MTEKCGTTVLIESDAYVCLRAICNRDATWQLLSFERNNKVTDREPAGIFECDEHKESIDLSSGKPKGLVLTWRKL